MKEERIKVLALLPMELPKEIELDNTLEAMQKFVGGLIECITLSDTGSAVTLVCNDEGKLLGLPFPSGKHIDALSRSAQDRQVFRVKVQGTTFSLSGVQNKVEQYHAAGNSPEETAGYALRCLIGAIVRATENALLEYPGSSVVFAGGVASNTLLRSSCAALPAVFCPPQFATDNALGVAVLTWRALHG